MMSQEKNDEWTSLENLALERVRRGQRELASSSRQLFQILVLPSFTSPTSWEIFEMTSRSEPSQFIAAYTTWPRNDDWRKFEESWKFGIPIHRLKHQPITPTIETQQIPLSEEFVAKAIAELQSISIPPFVALKNLGVDGTSYELLFDESFVGARYWWWGSLPPEWQPLQKVVMALLNNLEQLLAKANPVQQ